MVIKEVNKYTGSEGGRWSMSHVGKLHNAQWWPYLVVPWLNSQIILEMWGSIQMMLDVAAS